MPRCVTIAVIAILLLNGIGPVTRPVAAATPFADPAFAQVWARTDQPVALGLATRTWFWGPEPLTAAMHERYLSAPEQQRLVQYFDKGRMEINDPAGDPANPWYVTSGLLTRELISGRIQMDTGRFLDAGSGAAIAVARDPDNAFPTYAALRDLIDRGSTDQTTVPATRALNPDGSTGIFPGAAADPGAVYARIVEHTHANLYKVDLGNGELEPLSPKNLYGDGSVMDGPSVSKDGKRLALIWSDGDKIEEVYTGAPFGDSKAVPEFGKDFNSGLSPVEHVTWMCDGHEIEGLLHLPHGYEKGKRYPLVVEIHGGPSWQWGNWFHGTWHDWGQILAAAGYAVFMPNPRGSTGRGGQFTGANRFDFGGGDFDDIMTGIDLLIERGVADPDRLGICGWSFGGFMTAWAVGHTDRFKAAVAGAAPTNWVSKIGTTDIRPYNEWNIGEVNADPDRPWERSPIRYVRNVTTPTLMVHGQADVRVPVTQATEFYAALKATGVPTDMVSYPRQGHAFHERAFQLDLLQRLVGWFERYLGPGAAPKEG